MKSLTQHMVLLILLINANTAASAKAAEESELNDLLALLEEQTELATQSKMNADYVPGMVSILHGSELESRGVNTVAEALNQVPGFYMTVDNAGAKVAIVRGVGASLNSTNIKLMLNGVAVNRAVDASADWLLRMPLGQVDRIEVIRGPGSALYGEFAFSGVINVIPRTDNRVTLKTGSHNMQQGSLTYSNKVDSNKLLRFNLSSWNQDNSGQPTSEDVFAFRGLGFSPGLRYDHEQGLALLAEANLNGYSLQLQHAKVERGGWFGRDAAIPEELAPRIEKAQGLHFSKTWELNADLNLSTQISSRKTETELAAFLPIVAGVDPPGPRPPILINLYRQAGDKDSTDRANIGLQWQISEQHHLLADVGYARSELDSAIDRHFELGQPAVTTTSLIGLTRSLSSVTLQDQWKVNEQLEITIGARHDNYDDWGSHTSPRFAVVLAPGR